MRKNMGTRDITFVVSMLRRNTCAIREPPYVRTLNFRESLKLLKEKKMPNFQNRVFFFNPCDIVAVIWRLGFFFLALEKKERPIKVCKVARGRLYKNMERSIRWWTL